MEEKRRRPIITRTEKFLEYQFKELENIKFELRRMNNILEGALVLALENFGKDEETQEENITLTTEEE